jgi:hypothetical protein
MDLDDTDNVPTTSAAAQEQQQSDHHSTSELRLPPLPLALKIFSGAHAAPIPVFLHSQVAKMFETTFHLKLATTKAMVEQSKCAVTGCDFNGFRTWGLFGASSIEGRGSKHPLTLFSIISVCHSPFCIHHYRRCGNCGRNFFC